MNGIVYIIKREIVEIITSQQGAHGGDAPRRNVPIGALEEMEDDAEEENSCRRTIIVEEPDDWDEDEA